MILQTLIIFCCLKNIFSYSHVIIQDCTYNQLWRVNQSSVVMPIFKPCLGAFRSVSPRESGAATLKKYRGCASTLTVSILPFSVMTQTAQSVRENIGNFTCFASRSNSEPSPPISTAELTSKSHSLQAPTKLRNSSPKSFKIIDSLLPWNMDTAALRINT